MTPIVLSCWRASRHHIQHWRFLASQREATLTYKMFLNLHTFSTDCSCERNNHNLVQRHQFFWCKQHRWVLWESSSQIGREVGARNCFLWLPLKAEKERLDVLGVSCNSWGLSYPCMMMTSDRYTTGWFRIRGISSSLIMNAGKWIIPSTEILHIQNLALQPLIFSRRDRGCCSSVSTS